MPALLTHYLCGNAMLKLIDNDYFKDILFMHRNVFNLGTQGPDIFFYYGAWPWTKSEGISKFGDRIHEEKTGEFILEAIKYVNESDEASKSLLTAYICGYLCHYALDCHTHPYIFYKTGFVRKGEKYTSKYTCCHRMFETDLDVLMLKRELGKSPYEFNASEQIRVSKQAAAAIGEMYSKVLGKVYAAGISTELVCRAIDDIAGIAAALRDKTGIKKKLLSRLEKSLGKQPMFSSMIMPLEVKDGLDYLNTSHSTWYLPWDLSNEHTSSFPEMFEAAAKEAKEMCINMMKSTFKKTNIEEALSLIGSRSFSTGADCNLDAEFKYFDCIYEKS